MQQVHRATLTIREAAELLGVSAWSCYQLARSGELAPGVPVLKVGRRLVVPRAAIEAALGIEQTSAQVAG
jgi:excisionase family DNA binding protein